VTAQHPVYSLDRGCFVAASELSDGERLATLAGPTAVLGIQPQHTAGQHKPQTVYNLEVQGQHVFRVTSNGLLVHNTCPPRDALGRFTSRSGGHTADAARGIAAHRSYRNALGGKYRFEVKLPSGKRADAVDFKNRIVRELKPDNPRTIQDGRRQLERYRQDLEREFGGTWTSFLDIYTP